MEPSSRGRGPGKDRPKPPILRWRVGSYKRPKKRIPLNDAAKFQCPNIARIRPSTEYCPLCKQWHPLLSSDRDELQFLVNVGTAGLDPFRRKRPEDDNPFCQQIIHSSIIFGWKNLIPLESSPGVYPIITTFYDMIRSRDSRYYSTLFGGMLHLHVMEKGAQALNSIPQLCLEMKSKTLQHLQREIDALVLEDREADDFTLSTVYVMAQHELNQEALRFPPLRYPTSPMANYQLLGSVGLMKMEPSHFKALYHLVAQRGGIHAIKTFGVANQLATGDLVTATISICPPRFACLWTPKSLVEMGCDITTISAQHLLATFGQHFTSLSSSSRRDIEPFINLLQAVKDVTIAIDFFANTGGKAPRIGELIALTNKVQYGLLCLGQPHLAASSSSTEENSPVSSLDVARNTPLSSASSLSPIRPPPDITLPAPSQTAAHAIQVLRIAALIYSDLIIFPLAYASGVRFKLAKRLCALLQMRIGARNRDDSRNGREKGRRGAKGDSKEEKEGLGNGKGQGEAKREREEVREVEREKEGERERYLLDDAKLEMWVLSMGVIACLPYYAATRTGVWLDERLRAVADEVCVADERKVYRRMRRDVGTGADGVSEEEAGRRNESEDDTEASTEDGDDEKDNAKASYEKYLDIMQRFWWWKPVCDEYARDLWRNLYNT